MRFFTNMKKLFLLILTSIVLHSGNLFSQNNKHNPLEQRFQKLQLILKNKYPKPTKEQFELTIFTNPKCGRCNELTKLVRLDSIPFISYDLKISKYGDLMRKLCYHKAGKMSIGIKYPVVVINDKVYYKIKNITEFVKEINEEFLKNKGLNKD